MRPVIHSQKHYVQVSRSTVLTGAVNSEDIVLSVEGTVANAVDEVIEGAIVKAVYVEMWVIGATADQHFVICVAKYPSGLATMGAATMAALGTYANKKNILYTTQGLASNDGIAQPLPLIRMWIKIPKSKQRFGLSDKLRLTIFSQGDGSIHYCGFFTYKEYT